MAIRLLLVDDHEIVRMGLETALGYTDEFQVVGNAGTMAEAVSQAFILKPDVIIMDVRLPDGTGIEACREILSQCPQTKVIMLTSYADEDAVIASVMAGASGFVMKEIGSEAIRQAITTVVSGGVIMDGNLTRHALEKMKHMDENSELEKRLSKREKGILTFIARGMTNKEIAFETYLSEYTIRNYVSGILHKLGFKNRSQLTAYILEDKHQKEKNMNQKYNF
ncbi:response regulator transcription factor [Desulfitobacterium sp.]|uniref:response regulator transcription factor n=1 Tax=Desulfitobacterium sp. TaxID=49981 RepID=UPI002BC0A41F|nr:response regulator transcription factor [Desulfitobacterium sp.]HVJ49704.1 response regulator transcription factor [Desulfitobacterium sp.]